MLGNAAGAFAKNKANNIRDQIGEMTSKVDWEDYNYPPCVNVVHYTLADVEEDEPRSAVWYANIAYTASVALLTMNLFITFVLAVGGVEDKGVHFVYSLLSTERKTRHHMRRGHR